MANSALRLGGDGGWSELMLKMQMMKVMRVGENQTIFMVETSDLQMTKVGVIPWPNTIPRCIDRDNIPVAINLSDSGNQF